MLRVRERKRKKGGGGRRGGGEGGKREKRETKIHGSVTDLSLLTQF